MEWQTGLKSGRLLVICIAKRERKRGAVAATATFFLLLLSGECGQRRAW